MEDYLSFMHILCFPVYLLELKYEILLIFGVQPDLKMDFEFLKKL